ncbi:MAG: SxtJ family membrane protein [Candidatus Xenobiia bacterium LiM19]
MKESSSDKLDRKKELRGFGLTVGTAFIVLGLFFIWRASRHGVDTPSLSYIFLGAGVLFTLSGIIAPSVLFYPHKGWSFLGEKLAWINTRIILTLVFALFIVPLGLFFKLLGKDLLGQRYDRKASTYWTVHSQPEDVRQSYERQF